jgi:hypothetical protein
MTRTLGIAPILNLMALTWWKWARKELTARDPMHADLPSIVRRINELEREAA